MQDDRSSPIFAVTMNDVLSSLSRRLDVSTLSPEDLELARQEVLEAINHHLDIREYIDMGLDAWEIIRRL